MLSDTGDAPARLWPAGMPTDPTTPHAARVLNYLLGGNENYDSDRRYADMTVMNWPKVLTSALANDGFRRRAVRFVAEEWGIRQFLDVGAGIPAVHATHTVAQRVDPTSRTVYVDNDQVVLAHARGSLKADPAGRSCFIGGDLRHPRLILDDGALTAVLDFSKPVALVITWVLHLFGDDEDPYGAVHTLVDALPKGSALVLSHPTLDFIPEQDRALDRVASGRFVSRTPEQLLPFFNGLDLDPYGLTVISEWRPNPDIPVIPRPEVSTYGGVARNRADPFGSPRLAADPVFTPGKAPRDETSTAGAAGRNATAVPATRPP